MRRALDGPALTGVPRLQRVDDLAAVDRLVFDQGIAAVIMPWSVARRLPWKNAERQPSPRLDAVKRAIRENGYQPFDPVIVRIGRKGRWIVVDGGHRLTAAAEVDREIWPNLFGRKVQDMYFLVFTTARSWSGLRDAAARIKAAAAREVSPLAHADARLAEVEAEAEGSD